MFRSPFNRPFPLGWIAAHAPLLVALFLIPPALAADPPIEPPLRINSQAPLQSLRLGLLPTTPFQLPRGAIVVQVSSTWANVWVNDRPALLLDYEALDSNILAAVGLSERTELQVEVEGRRAFGGLMDPLIQNVHRGIGNGLNGRDGVGRGEVNVVIRNPRTGEILLEEHDGGPFSSGLLLSLSRRTPFAGGQASYAGTVRFPLRHSRNEVWSTVDGGVSLAWSRVIRGRSIHLGAGLSRFAKSESLPFELDRQQRTAFAAIVRPVTRRTSVIAQYLYNEGVAGNGALSRSANEVTFGARFRPNDDTAIDVGILENIVNFDNGPDFGVHVAVSRRVR